MATGRFVGDKLAEKFSRKKNGAGKWCTYFL